MKKFEFIQGECRLLINEPQRDVNELAKLEVDGSFPAYTRLTICLTFIQFGLDAFEGVRTTYKPFLEETEVVTQTGKCVIDPSLNDEVNLFEQHGGLGKKFVQFLEFLLTLNFAWLKRQSFVKFKHYSVFANQQHVRLHKAAESSYYRLCLTDDFSAFPVSKSLISLHTPLQSGESTRPAIDGDAFIFELPVIAKHSLSNQERINNIVEKTGVQDLAIRPLTEREGAVTTQFVVTVAGSIESMNMLRRLFAPTGYINCPLVEMKLAGALSSQVFYRLSEIEPPTDEEMNSLRHRQNRRNEFRNNRR